MHVQDSGGASVNPQPPCFGTKSARAGTLLHQVIDNKGRTPTGNQIITTACGKQIWLAVQDWYYPIIDGYVSCERCTRVMNAVLK